MRKILLLYIILSGVFLNAQTTQSVVFAVTDNGVITFTPEQQENAPLTEPVQLIFPIKLKDQVIQIIDANATDHSIIKDIKMGDRTVFDRDENGNFLLVIHANSLLKNKTEMPGSFILRIAANNYGPFYVAKPAASTAQNSNISTNANAGSDSNTNSGPNTNSNQVNNGNNSQTKVYKPGFLFYDAQELENVLEGNGNRGNASKILSAYGFASNTISESQNPYKGVITQIYSRGGVEGGGGALSSAFSSVGGLDVTNFVDGLAKFLVERTQQELSVAFFQKMKEQFGNLPEFRIFFPNTYKILDAIESYQYATLLQTLKESFEADIRALPLNLPKIRNFDATYCDGNPGTLKDKCVTRMTSIHNFFSNDETGNYTALGLVAVENIAQGNNPADIIDNVAGSPEMDRLLARSEPASKDCGATILLANLISQSLLSTDNGKVWVSQGQLKSLFNTPTGWQIYLALLYQKYTMSKKEIIFYDNTTAITFDTILNRVHRGNLDGQVIQTIKIFSGFVNSVNETTQKITQSGNNSVSADFMASYDYFKATSTALDALASLPVINGYAGAQKLKNMLENVVDPAVDMVYSIATKKYSAAILDLDVFVEKSGMIKETPVVKDLLKYGTFISTVATAQNSDDVKKAIEAIALPVGSASIKKKSVFTVSLNAYVAPFVGREHYKYYDHTGAQQTDIKTAAGLYAPVGIGFNFGLWKGECNKKNTDINTDINNAWSMSVFVSLIDIGAVVAYRFQDDTASLGQTAKIRLGDIFSPGGNFIVGFPRVPISLGVGCNWMPTLEKFYADQAPEQRPNGFRVFACLGVDIPVLHFSRKTNN